MVICLLHYLFVKLSVNVHNTLWHPQDFLLRWLDIYVKISSGSQKLKFFQMQNTLKKSHIIVHKNAFSCSLHTPLVYSNVSSHNFTGSNVTESRGVLVWWQLKLYGSPMSPDEVQERKR